LNGAYTGDLSKFEPEYQTDSNVTKASSSVQLREYCLRNAMGVDMTDVKGSDENWNIRNWTKPESNN
jgi:hypothetical protein